MSDNTEFATGMLPVPEEVELSGDILTNWKMFHFHFSYFTVGTGLNKKPEAIRCAMLLSVIGKDCLKIFQSPPLNETGTKVYYLYFFSILAIF